MKDFGTAAKEAYSRAASLPGEIKSKALTKIAEALEGNAETIYRENQKDLAEAEKTGLPGPIRKRLAFTQEKLETLAKGIRELAEMNEPVGRVIEGRELDTGLNLYKVASPIGVIGIIFESRPDALVQISTLCLKSGNCVLLKGGKEAVNSNRILFRIIYDAGLKAGIPEGWMQLLETRDEVASILTMEDTIDLIIPRGSNEFVRYIMDNTRIPVLGHADGLCHVYIDGSANPDMAVRISVDSKTQYVAVCNAAETILVHKDIAPVVLPSLEKALSSREVTIKGCPRVREYINAEKAEESDWKTEYLDLIVSVKVIDSAEEAIDHINRYGSKHTDSIVTSDRETAQGFMERVDSASVMWNCSTRFADGFRYGLGAEVGISTSKIHARGPVGIEGLMTYKWKLQGTGQIVADYTGEKGRRFTHKPL
ncbi:MAG: glutamate-5-semialdehyde dehydrogenase [Spirochaetia bacterium]